MLTYRGKKGPPVLQNINSQTGTGRRLEEDMSSLKHKFSDHVCRNTSEQSTFAVLSIIEMVAHHVSVQI